jgi:hypothetical protein
MPRCFFVVRAVVTDPAQRPAFEKWYRDEHLAPAIKAFGAERGWRCWSETDPSVHLATYQFADRAALDRGTAPEILKPLIADFDRAFPGVTRTREILTLVEERSS